MNQRIRRKHKYQLMHLCFHIAYKDKGLTRKTLRRLRVLLKFEVQRDPSMPTYGYTASTTAQLISHIEYCSDRWNPGRARAVLLLLDEQYPVRHGVYQVTHVGPWHQDGVLV